MYTYKLYILLALFYLHCSTMKESHQQNNEATLIIEMRKTPCFGTCPVYNLYIYDNRKIEYQGIKYVDKLGLFKRTLSAQQYEGIRFAFEEARFDQMDNEYDGPVSDLPSTIISFTKDGHTKTVKGRYGTPQNFKNLENILHSLAMSTEAWEPLDDPDRDPNIISNEIIVQLKENTSLDQLVTDFKSYGVQQAGKIAPSMNMWLIRYDTQKIASRNMLQKVLGHPSVKMAEFNKKVQIR